MTTAMTPNAPHHAGLHPLGSRFVKAQDMPWQATRFAGIEAKTLLVDRPNGLVTVLMRMAPGAILPDHEHVQIEQTYVLEGHLVDRSGPDEGMEVGPGEFIWRPAGSRHSAWSPNGGMFIAMFQIPNKFFEGQDKVVDMSGADWAELWGSVHAGQAREKAEM
jgi:anti-sigma factor ChrR (cupin superfamily)